jgi:hypothetical protein
MLHRTGTNRQTVCSFRQGGGMSVTGALGGISIAGAHGMVMAKKAKSKFDPKVFLATVDGGLTKSNYRKGQTIFKQGDPMT